MSTPSRQTIIVPINLGTASNYDRDIFPLVSYRKRDKLGQGEFLLDATLDELLKISSMSSDPRQLEEDADSAKSRYDQLRLQQATLEERAKSKTPLQMLNIRKTLKDYRAISIFLDAAKTLYAETRSRSEQMRRKMNRELLSVVPQENLEPVGDNVPPNANITGLAVTVDGSLDEATTQSMVEAANSLSNPFTENPFADPLRSAIDTILRDWDAANVASGQIVPSDATSPNVDPGLQTSSPTSPGSSSSVYNISIIQNSIISPRSTLRGTTLNKGGSQNSGSQG